MAVEQSRREFYKDEPILSIGAFTADRKPPAMIATNHFQSGGFGRERSRPHRCSRLSPSLSTRDPRVGLDIVDGMVFAHQMARFSETPFRHFVETAGKWRDSTLTKNCDFGTQPWRGSATRCLRKPTIANDMAIGVDSDRSVSRALALVAIVANTTTPLILGTVQAHAHGVDGDPPSEFRVVCSAGGLGFLGGKDIDPQSDIDGNMDNSRPVCSAPSINALSVDPIDFRGFLPIAARRARITFSHNVQKRGQVFRVRHTARAPPVLP